MNCAGCQRTLEVGDRYIKFKFSEWTEREGHEPLEGIDDLVGEIMGSDFGEQIVYCDDCTTEAPDGWMQDIVYGDET